MVAGSVPCGQKLWLRASAPHRFGEGPAGGTDGKESRLCADLRYAPPREVLVKRRGALEHKSHGRHRAGVPVTNVLVEADGVVEHIVHARH